MPGFFERETQKKIAYGCRTVGCYSTFFLALFGAMGSKECQKFLLGAMTLWELGSIWDEILNIPPEIAQRRDFF